jgi:hypothetical protein
VYIYIYLTSIQKTHEKYRYSIAFGENGYRWKREKYIFGGNGYWWKWERLL